MEVFLRSLFSIAAYCYFFWILPLQITAWLINLPEMVPALQPYFLYSINENPRFTLEGFWYKFFLDVALLGLFAIPHSIFARPAVKAKLAFGNWMRPLYVFKSALSLHVLVYFWQPFDERILWSASGTSKHVVLGIYAASWIWLVSSTFALDHTELFGLKQGLGIDIYGMLGFGFGDGFSARLHYKFVRHPIMLGFFGMFFAAPTMTVSHLFFALSCTAYILIAIRFLEEPDLVIMLGDPYKDYQDNTPMYCPFTKCKGLCPVQQPNYEQLQQK